MARDNTAQQPALDADSGGTRTTPVAAQPSAAARPDLTSPSLMPSSPSPQHEGLAVGQPSVTVALPEVPMAPAAGLPAGNEGDGPPAPQLTATAAPALSEAEIVRMQAAISGGQARMSRARAAFRRNAIAKAEQELKRANEQLQKARSAPPDAADLAAAKQGLDKAQVDLQQAHDARARSSAESAQVTLDAAQARLAALGTPADPRVVAGAQERLAVAQRNWEQVASASSAKKTEAESTMYAIAAAVDQARAAFHRSVQQYQTAVSGIDPESGASMVDGVPETQQLYAAAMAEQEQRLLALETDFTTAHAAFEAARQQEINGNAAARAEIDQASAELERVSQGPPAEAVAQAQAAVAAAQRAVDESRAVFKTASSAVAQAEVRVAEAQATLDKVQGAGNPSAVAAAQVVVDQATTRLAIVRRSGVKQSGWAWPTYGWISSGFGPRDMRVGRNHNGVDIAAAKGTPIAAARDGTVIEAGWCDGYGYCVKLAHSGGFSSEYGHLDNQPVVQTGQHVTVGTIMGQMGSTYDEEHGGYSTGVHLHFTIRRNGAAVDPLLYLP